MSLSDKRIKKSSRFFEEDGWYMYLEEELKEAIKELKKLIKINSSSGVSVEKHMYEIIDKIFGDKLNGK